MEHKKINSTSKDNLDKPQNSQSKKKLKNGTTNEINEEYLCGNTNGQNDTKIELNDKSTSNQYKSTPSKWVENPQELLNTSISEKSRSKYEVIYTKFMHWRSSNNITDLSEKTMLTYFYMLAENLKPSTLWAMFSMLRSTIQIKHRVNIASYSNLLAYLKQKHKGFKSKPSDVLSAAQVNQFLQEAPDNKYLAIKVALIFGIQGACKRSELCDLTINDLEDKGNMLLVKIPKTKYDKPRSFVITDDFYRIYKKYADLRPTRKSILSKRFFLHYRDGKCSGQVIGVNSFGSMPKTVAKYLNLKNPEHFTGHSFRKTSSSIMGKTGVDLQTLESHRKRMSNGIIKDYPGNLIVDPLEDRPEKELCLICLNKTTTTFSLHKVIKNKNLTVYNLLQEFDFFNEAVSKNSSKIICSPCLQRLQSSYDFKLQCKRSKEFWKQLPTKTNNSYLENIDSNQVQETMVSTKPSTSKAKFVSILKKKIKLEPDFEIFPESDDKSENCDDIVKMEFEEISIKEELDEYDKEPLYEISTIKKEVTEVDESVDDFKSITKIICSLCHIPFFQTCQFWEHFKKDHHTNQCIEIIPTEQCFNNKSFSKKLTFYCGICDSCFYNINNFVSHLEFHPTNNLCKCSFCNEEFFNLIEFVNHYVTHFNHLL